MTRRRPLFRYLLLLMLAAGPLQARTVLLCDMMDVPRQEICCCDEQTGAVRETEPGAECDRPPCHVAQPVDAGGCCTSAVEMSYEPDAGRVVINPPSDRTDPTPSIPILIAYDLPVPPKPTERAPDPRPEAVVIPDGSNLYLRTERLRI